MSNVTPCNKCNTKDAEIARLKALVTELERPKTAAERGAADGKKSRAAYMAKRRAAAKSKPSV